MKNKIQKPKQVNRKQKKLTPEAIKLRNKLICKMYKSAIISQSALMAKFGITKLELWKVLYNHKGQIVINYNVERDLEICSRYNKEFITQSELARQYGVCRERIRQILYYHDVKIKPRNMLK
jgi:hypothetical protein